MPASSEELGSRVRRIYDSYEILLDAWGENTHPGIYLQPDEPISVAAERASERLADGAGFRAGERVLETGCGFGGAARSPARRFGVEVVGTNVSELQLAIARFWAVERYCAALVGAGFESVETEDGRATSSSASSAFSRGSPKTKGLPRALRQRDRRHDA